MQERLSASQIRARLGHPVIDLDGHMWEVESILLEHLDAVAGAPMVDKYRAQLARRLFSWERLDAQQRQATRVQRPIGWGVPTHNTKDFASMLLPELLYERLPEAGTDFCVIYPTLGMYFVQHPDEDLRRATCRAFNEYYAEQLKPFADRLAPSATIPMHTPDEAVEEIRYATETLGMKSIMLPSAVMREEDIGVRYGVPVGGSWVDCYGVDSRYDYDAVWQACVECKVAPTCHSPGYWGTRCCGSSALHNHLGAFAAANESFCRSIFLDGVTHRFPALRFGLLEGGVAWAVSLLNDLVEHWAKRNAVTIAHGDPARLDLAELSALFQRYGGIELSGDLERDFPGVSQFAGWRRSPEDLDEWTRCGIDTEVDFHERYVSSFHFGCEADDLGNAAGFDPRLNALGVALRASFASDRGHWDNPDPPSALSHAYTLVERGLLDNNAFFDFTFGNAVRLHCALNTSFFDGTVIEDEVARFVSSPEFGDSNVAPVQPDRRG